LTIINTDDPCAAAATLRKIYLSVVTGQSAAEVEIASGNGATRRVKYTPANLTALSAELSKYEGLCRALGGDQRPKRFGLRAGGRI
jgi:hypothetical protein